MNEFEQGSQEQSASFSGADLAKELEASKEAEPFPGSKAQLERLGEMADLPVLVTGGYAEEALLHGTVTREHHDIDLLAMRSDSAGIAEQLVARGYDVQPQPGPNGEPYKLLVQKEGVEGDIALLDFDSEQQQPYIDLQNQDGTEHRVFFNEDFSGQQTAIDGQSLRTASPLTLIQQREAVVSTGRFEPRPRDGVVQGELKQKFFPGANDDSLKPRIERIGGQASEQHVN